MSQERTIFTLKGSSFPSSCRRPSKKCLFARHNARPRRSSVKPNCSGEVMCHINQEIFSVKAKLRISMLHAKLLDPVCASDSPRCSQPKNTYSVGPNCFRKSFFLPEPNHFP